MAATPQPAQTKVRHWIRPTVIAAIVLLVLGGVALLCVTIEPFRTTVWRTVGQNCGQVVTGEFQAANGADQTRAQVEACFMRAWTACRAATMSVETHNLDTGSSDTFVVEPAFGPLRPCGLSDAWSQTVNVHTTVGFTTCANVTQQPDGLHFIGCGQFGTIVAPV